MRVKIANHKVQGKTWSNFRLIGPSEIAVLIASGQTHTNTHTDIHKANKRAPSLQFLFKSPLRKVIFFMIA